MLRWLLVFQVVRIPVECKECGAERDEQCSEPGLGRVRDRLHGSRIRALKAMRAWEAPALGHLSISLSDLYRSREFEHQKQVNQAPVRAPRTRDGTPGINQGVGGWRDSPKGSRHGPPPKDRDSPA